MTNQTPGDEAAGEQPRDPAAHATPAEPENTPAEPETVAVAPKAPRRRAQLALAAAGGAAATVVLAGAALFAVHLVDGDHGHRDRRERSSDTRTAGSTSRDDGRDRGRHDGRGRGGGDDARR